MAYDINKVTYRQQKNRPHRLMSLSEHVENYRSKISNKSNEYRLSKSAYHLSELAGRFGPCVNGTRQFWELRELVLAELALLLELGQPVLSLLRGYTREMRGNLRIAAGVCSCKIPGFFQSPHSKWLKWKKHRTSLVSMCNLYYFLLSWLPNDSTISLFLAKFLVILTKQAYYL